MQISNRSNQTQVTNKEIIKDAAWKHIAEFGAPALSLRAIARSLKITAPAIYNYFPDRDALVTALIVDAYTSFGNWQIEAYENVASENHSARLIAIGMAYRNWAHTFPQRYHLLFGTPIPGYVAPLNDVFLVSTRSRRALIEVVENARVAGKLKIDSVKDLIPIRRQLSSSADIVKKQLSDIHPHTYYIAMIIWARVHGMVSLEIDDAIFPFGKNNDELYRLEINLIVNQFIS